LPILREWAYTEKTMKDDHVAILLEQISGQMSQFAELIGDMLKDVAQIKQDVGEIKDDVKAIKSVIKDHSGQLDDHEHRIATLEAV